jgi:hypothetical protein
MAALALDVLCFRLLAEYEDVKTSWDHRSSSSRARGGGAELSYRQVDTSRLVIDRKSPRADFSRHLLDE